MILYLLLAEELNPEKMQQANSAVTKNDFESGKLAFTAGKHREACAFFESWLRHNPNSIEAKAYLGAVYDELSKHEEAQKILRECIKVYKRNPNNNKKKLAFALMHLGKSLSQSGKYEDSAKALKESISLYSTCDNTQKINLARANTLLAETYMYRGSYKEAEPYFKTAISIYPKDDPQILWTKLRLARLYIFTGNYAEAKSILEKGIACLRTGTDKDKLGWNLFYLGDVYRSLGDFNQAERTMAEGFEAFAACGYEKDHQITQWAKGYYGRLLCDQRKYTEAQPILEASLHVHEAKYGENSKRNGFIMQALANAYAHQGFFKGADLLFRDTLAVYEKQFGKEHTEYALVLRDYGRLAFLQKKFPTAITRLAQAHAVLQAAEHSEAARCKTYLEEAQAAISAT